MTLTWCRVQEIAKKRDVSMAQIALAWILSKEGMLILNRCVRPEMFTLRLGVTAPIVGTTSLEKLKDLIGKSFESPSSPYAKVL